MRSRFAICVTLAAAVGGLGMNSSRVGAAVIPIFDFVAPAGWTAGAAGSTYQEWAADPSDPIDGEPNVGFHDGGAGLAQPVLSAAAPGFVAGSGGFYSFSGGYTVTAALNHSTIAAPADAGTYVIVQTFATINPDDGDGHSGTVLDESLTDGGGAAIVGAQHLRSTVYGWSENFPTSFGAVDVQATIDEYWLPGLTGDVQTLIHMLDDTSVQGVRIDSIIASAGAGGAAPFAVTAVPEPLTLAAMGVGGALLLRRRRR